MLTEFHLNTVDIIIRVFLATFAAGLIGYDREQHSHPAGMRTHILVAVGACILALTQVAACQDVIALSIKSTREAFAIRTDVTRLIAQIVSGIGFLGAGTIVVTHRFVSGLTTAASLWTVAAIGLTVGMGYYQIAIIGTVMVLFDLLVLHRIVPFDPIRRVEVKFYNGPETTERLDKYFKDQSIFADHTGFKSNNYSADQKKRIYTSIYTVKLPKDKTFSDMIDELSKNENIIQVTVISM